MIYLLKIYNHAPSHSKFIVYACTVGAAAATVTSACPTALASSEAGQSASSRSPSWARPWWGHWTIARLCTSKTFELFLIWCFKIRRIFMKWLHVYSKFLIIIRWQNIPTDTVKVFKMVFDKWNLMKPFNKHRVSLILILIIFHFSFWNTKDIADKICKNI